jgi:hypothetical protein
MMLQPVYCLNCTRGEVGGERNIKEIGRKKKKKRNAGKVVASNLFDYQSFG